MKFIIRDTAQLGEPTDKQFVKTKARQRGTPERKGVDVSPSEERSKEAVKSFIGQFFWVFVYLWPSI